MAYVERAEDMEVFKKAYPLSLDLHKISLGFPKIEQYDLASQVRRASKSVCANLGEGFLKQKIYPGELKRFVAMSLGSSGEMRIWLKYCLDLGYINQEQFNNMNNEYDVIIKMLMALARS